MRTDVQSRGFSLTPALRAAVDREARAFAERFPNLTATIKVRLFDVNGLCGGLDKGCLLHAQVGEGEGRINIVASDLDSNLYRAIDAAFVRLERGARNVLGPRSRRPLRLAGGAQTQRVIR